MHRRSRRGCVICLQQHKKCDEQQPICSRCSRLQLHCDYNRSLRWFNGDRLSRSRRRDQSRQDISRSSGATATEALAPRQTGSALAAATLEAHDTSYKTSGCDAFRSEDEFRLAGTTTPEAPTPSNDNPPGDDEFQAISTHSTVITVDYNCQTAETSSTPREPHEALARHTPTPTDGHRNQILRNRYSPSTSSPTSPTSPTGTLAEAGGIRQQSPSPPDQELALGPPCPFDADFRKMIFHDNGRYMAYMYFVRSVSLILPGRGGVRNGYRQIAAAALSSPMLLDTVVSVATVYMHLRGSAPASLALDRQSRAIASLRRDLNTLGDSSAPSVCAEVETLKRDILATILLQVTVEIANGTSFVQTHMAHAHQLFRELGYDQGRPLSALGQILVQRMTFVEVLSSVFWRRRPNLPMSFWFFTHGENQPSDGACAAPTFQETTGCPLWVISALARISHLIADVDNGAPNDLVISLAYQLDADLAISLRFYETAPATPAIEDEEHKCLHIVGRCYYWSATILLQRRVFKDPPTSRRVQFSLRRLMTLLDSLPIGCGPDSQLSLALYAAALAAVVEDDRDAIRAKSVRLSEQYPMKTRDALTATFASMWADMDSQLREESGRNSQIELTRDLMKERRLFIC